MKVFVSFSYAESESLGPLVERLQIAGYDVTTADTLEANPSAIMAAIHSSQALVAVLSRASPNVYFELGLAFGAGLPAIVLAGQDVEIPVDIASTPFVKMTGDARRDLRSLEVALANVGSSALARVHGVSEQEPDFEAITIDAQLIDRLDPESIERMVGELLKSRGWVVERSAVRNGAEVDLLLSEGPDKVTVVEVKKVGSQGRVSVDAVRQLLSKMTIVGAHTGALISTAGFTSSAVAMAAGTGAVLVTLAELVANRSKLARKTED